MVRKWATLMKIINCLIGCQVFDGAGQNRGSSGGDCLILHTPDEGRQPRTIHDHTKSVAAAIYWQKINSITSSTCPHPIQQAKQGKNYNTRPNTALIFCDEYAYDCYWSFLPTFLNDVNNRSNQSKVESIWEFKARIMSLSKGIFIRNFYKEPEACPT